ncbi:MAG: hypothetical protein QOK38_3256, partial [Acidobacteriaceae bacterium]|nr:hypothetical protein [Acidobacteriaceae bacterium]
MQREPYASSRGLEAARCFIPALIESFVGFHAKRQNIGWLLGKM